MLEKYKNICNKLKINYKSEMFMCIGLLILSLIMMISLSILVSFAVGLLVLIIYVAIIYFHLSKINQKYMLLISRKQKAFEILFLSLLNYFKANFSLNNALLNCINICDDVLKDDLNELILEIKDDNSLVPFLKFTNDFIDDNCKQKALYLHSLLNVKETSEFVYVLQTFCIDGGDYTSDYMIEYQSKQIEKYKFVPLALSIVSVLIIFAYIFSTIGEITNG